MIGKSGKIVAVVGAPACGKSTFARYIAENYKVKTFHDAEYKVLSANFGPFRYVKEGKEVEEEMLAAVVIEHKGNNVSVGSGFSIDQRKNFFAHPEYIVGKEITVQYFEESQNQNGDYSLRFPVIKAIYENKRSL